MALSHSPLISIINDPRSPRAMLLRRNRFNVVSHALILEHKTRRASSIERRTVAIMPRSLVSHFVSRGRRLRSDLRNKNVFALALDLRRSRDKGKIKTSSGDEGKRWRREEKGELRYTTEPAHSGPSGTVNDGDNNSCSFIVTFR